ncbi:MAG: hypothetical protein LBR90_03340 [Elusimicrobiota bacterium]|jgi:hypothetical protein|nr:hypothetical protein [Elusimicrobiota bacterium]
MKPTIKFLLALGSSKLVMLQEGGATCFYTKSSNNYLARGTSLRRIAGTLIEK